MRIFLLAGKAGSGKSSVAKIIQKLLPHTVITNLSKYIKLFAMEMTSWNGCDETKPREFLQTTGDELRNIKKDFLTKRMLEDIEFYKKYYHNVVISDVRLVDEINYFKKLTEFEVITIHITSSKKRRNLTEKEKMHYTEMELDQYRNFDYRIENNDATHLEKEIKEILGRID